MDEWIFKNLGSSVRVFHAGQHYTPRDIAVTGANRDVNRLSSIKSEKRRDIRCYWSNLKNSFKIVLRGVRICAPYSDINAQGDG
jgi:hypothetical protein